MTKKKDAITDTAATKATSTATAPAQWTGESVHETRCYKCNGMVNGNGCGMDGCPVAAKRSGN
jgi:hypothetical protein